MNMPLHIFGMLRKSKLFVLQNLNRGGFSAYEHAGQNMSLDIDLVGVLHFRSISEAD